MHLLTMSTPLKEGVGGGGGGGAVLDHSHGNFEPGYLNFSNLRKRHET